jgi:hypothetical protein
VTHADRKLAIGHQPILRKLNAKRGHSLQTVLCRVLDEDHRSALTCAMPLSQEWNGALNPKRSASHARLVTASPGPWQPRRADTHTTAACGRSPTSAQPPKRTSASGSSCCREHDAPSCGRTFHSIAAMPRNHPSTSPFGSRSLMRAAVIKGKAPSARYLFAFVSFMTPSKP